MSRDPNKVRKEQVMQIPGGKAAQAEGTRAKDLRQKHAWHIQSSRVAGASRARRRGEGEVTRQVTHSAQAEL